MRGDFVLFFALFSDCASCWPGVARRPVTFLASPRKVTKRSAPDTVSRSAVRVGAHKAAIYTVDRGLSDCSRTCAARYRVAAAPGEPALRASLRYSTSRAAAELALAATRQGLRQSSPKPPDSFALLGGSQGENRENPWQ